MPEPPAVAPLPPAGPPSGPGRYRRVLGAIGASLGLTVVFAGALVVSVAAHLDLGPTRRTVRAIANVVLATTFKGTIVVGEIDRLSLRGLRVRSATALDPSGVEVARLVGIRADADVVGIAVSALSGALRVPIPLVHVDHAEVVLDRGSGGGIGIAETFLLRDSTPSPPDAVVPRVSLSRIEVDHVWAHGAIAPPTLVDAELRHVIGTVEVSQEGVALDVGPAALEARAPVPRPLAGDVGFHLRVPPSRGATPAAPRIDATFDGKLGELGLRLAAGMEGSRISAKIEVPRAMGKDIAALLPDPSIELPLRVPLSVKLSAEGELAALPFQLDLDFDGRGAIGAKGELRVDKSLGVDVDVSVKDLDPRVALDLPSATPLRARAHARVETAGGLAIKLDASTEPLTIAAQRIPAVDAEAALAHGVWRGSAKVHEDGVPASASFSYDPAAGLTFAAEARAASLRAVSRARVPVDGSAQVKVSGTLRGRDLDARIEARVDGVRMGREIALDHATLDGRVRGSVDRPAELVIDRARIDGRGVRVPGHAWAEVHADADGPLAGLPVHAALSGGSPSLDARGKLDPRASAIRGVSLSIDDASRRLSGGVAEVAFGPQGLRVEGISLAGEGVGAIDGTLAVQGKELIGKLRGRDVDLAEIARMARLPPSAGIAGLANIDVDLSSARPGQRHGHVAIELVNGEVAKLGSIGAHLHARFAGDRVRVDGLVRLVAHASPKEKAADRCDGSIASIRVTGGEGVLGGGLLDPEPWRRLSGRVDVAAEDLNLRCLARVASLDLLVSEIRGKLAASATIERKPDARVPSVTNVLARTRGLEVAAPMGFGDDRPAWESRAVDLEIGGAFDPASRIVNAKVTVTDGSPIASVEANLTMDVLSFLDHPDRRAELLRAAPIIVRVNVPRRAVGAFGSLPSFVRDHLPTLAGDVELKGSLRGTLDAPRLSLRAHGWDLAHAYPAEPPAESAARAGKPAPNKQPPPESPWGVPIDLALDVKYDGRKSSTKLSVLHDKREVLSAGADLDIALADVLAGKPLRPKGHVDAKVMSLPLGDIPFFADRGIQGRLDGKVALTGLGEAPALKVALDFPDLRIGPDLAYDESSIQIDIERPRGKNTPPNRGAATARFALSSKTGGKLTASAFSDIVWQNSLVPTIDPKRPADFVVKASRFRIAALGPFVAGVLSRVDGVLEGDARVGWTHLEDDDDKGKLAVRMKLSDGVFHVPQLGQELHDAEVQIVGGANGVILMEGLRADGTKGRITGSGKAKFNGLRFARAEAAFRIKPGEELPIALEGVPLGDTRGEVKIVAEKRDKKLAVTVDVPTLHLELPRNTGRGVQSLDDNPDIFIVQERPRPKEQASGGATKMALTFNLGDIGIKGSLGAININLDVGLAGVKGAPLKVELADKARISGAIQFSRGRVELLKRAFEVERGVVNMRPEDAGNPYVNVTARWDSPEGPIYIDYVGVLMPIAPEKIVLRSPTIPDNRIMATLLSGGVEQASSGAGADKGANPVQGQSLALIAQQFSKQIAGNVSTSVSATEDGTFRPGLVYNSGDKIIELSTYGATGNTPTGGGAALKGQRTVITVDWRFWRNWMLRGRVDAGSDQTTSGVDVLWQYRY